MSEQNDTAKAQAATDKKATAKVAEEVQAERTPAAPIGENRFQLKEHNNPGFWICVPHGTTVDDLLDPGFWANVARNVRRNTTIEVHWDDSSRFAEVYVVDSGRNWASVSLLREHVLAKAKQPVRKSNYQIAFNGPVDKFRITRLSDNSVIRAGFATERDAHLYLEDYLRKLAA